MRFVRVVEPNVCGDFGIIADGTRYNGHALRSGLHPLSEKKSSCRTAVVEGHDEGGGTARSGGDASGSARELATHLPGM